MADSAPVVHIGENSPEKVAFDLLRVIAGNENMAVAGVSGGQTKADRKWISDTYAECLDAVHGRRNPGAGGFK